jgi:hypothetical protein
VKGVNARGRIFLQPQQIPSLSALTENPANPKK